jgi:predicted metalloprotease with PDZ domain
MALNATRKGLDLRYSLGVALSEDGTVTDVVPGFPAPKAGIGPGMKIIAVEGRKYSSGLIREALKSGKTGSAPLELLVANGEFYKTYRADYHGGERDPYLERDSTKPDLLTPIITSIVKEH